MKIINTMVSLNDDVIAQTKCFTNISEGTCVQPDSNCTMMRENDRNEMEVIQTNNPINKDFKGTLFHKTDNNSYYVTFITNTNFNYKIGGNTLVGLDIENNPQAQYYYQTLYVLSIVDHTRFANTVLPFRNKECKYFVRETLENYVGPLFRTVIQDFLGNAADDYGHAKVDRHNIELTNKIKKLLNDQLIRYGLKVEDIDPTRKGVDEEMIDVENKYKLNN